ncbi:hypothetical protein H0H87_000313 [Tephrocybe sp. NHM501043]|nr:hypothetical protein H0H87_000313 [Tephrocybe sp. NHM501043]
MNPSIRLDGKVGSTTSTEQVHQPWTIESGKAPDTVRADSNGVLWRYTHNPDGGHRPVRSESFDYATRPTMEIALDDALPVAFPEIDVEIVILWSIDSKKRIGKLLFPRRRNGKSKSELPANLNFLHRVALAVDLRKLHGNVNIIVIDGDVKDEIPPLSADGGSKQYTVQQLGLSSKSLSSNVEIYIEQAIEGRVNGLTRGEKSGEPVLTTITNYS